MSNNLEFSDTPQGPLIPGSGKFKSIETTDLKIASIINSDDLIITGTLQANELIVPYNTSTANETSILTSGIGSNFQDPLNPQDSATKQYADSKIGTAGGSEGDIQYNEGLTTFNGSSNLNWNNTDNELNIKGTLTSTNIDVNKRVDVNLTINNIIENTVQLEVAALSSDYSLTMPPNTGSSGQVLSTDGTGTLTWENPAGPGGSGTQIQYNDGSDGFAASSKLTWNSGTTTFDIDSGGIGVISTSTLETTSSNYTPTGSTSSGTLGVTETETLIINDSGTTNTITLASSSLASDYNMLLPDLYPLNDNSNLLLTTDGDPNSTGIANLSWSFNNIGPGGENTDIQFNKNGAFDGTDKFSFSAFGSGLGTNTNKWYIDNKISQIFDRDPEIIDTYNASSSFVRGLTIRGNYAYAVIDNYTPISGGDGDPKFVILNIADTSNIILVSELTL